MTEENKQQQSVKKLDTRRIVRILAKDIEGSMTVYSGLAKIKGISWSVSNAICKILKIPKEKKVGELSPEEIEKISTYMKNPDMPQFLLNRQKDFDTGADKHLISSDLELQHEFDIKRLKKIKSYRGFRHMSGLPLRGQRTKSNFRRNRRKGAGIKKS